MSAWYEADENDIDIDHVDREVSIFVKADNNGRVYLSLSFNQVKKLAASIESQTNGSSGEIQDDESQQPHAAIPDGYILVSVDHLYDSYLEVGADRCGVSWNKLIGHVLKGATNPPTLPDVGSNV